MWTIKRKDGRRVHVSIFDAFGGGRTIRPPRKARPLPLRGPSPALEAPSADPIAPEPVSRPPSKRSFKTNSAAKTVSSSTTVFSDTITESAIDQTVDPNAVPKSKKGSKDASEKSAKESKASSSEPRANPFGSGMGLDSIKEDVSEWLEGISKGGEKQGDGRANLTTTDGEELSTQQLILLGELHAQYEKKKYIQIACKFFDKTGKHLDPKEIRRAIHKYGGK
ncbi:MAG: hypothetical protein MMC33_005905 [Icmadophila ericetorum]|nr:hypothetical protein [Icmadophila ericetorum]